jgi:hypothetical protein
MMLALQWVGVWRWEDKVLVVRGLVVSWACQASSVLALASSLASRGRFGMHGSSQLCTCNLCLLHDRKGRT